MIGMNHLSGSFKSIQILFDMFHSSSHFPLFSFVFYGLNRFTH